MILSCVIPVVSGQRYKAMACICIYIYIYIYIYVYTHAVMNTTILQLVSIYKTQLHVLALCVVT